VRKPTEKQRANAWALPECNTYYIYISK
jgi:hypothetical protein